MSASTWLAGESVEAILAQLDPVLAAIDQREGPLGVTSLLVASGGKLGYRGGVY
jgi:hypothetical protein